MLKNQLEIQPNLLFKSAPPYMPTSTGLGVMGDIVLDKSTGRLMCYFCGKFFRWLSKHTERAHDTSADDYRKTFGLSAGTALCDKLLSRKRSLDAQNRPEGVKKKFLQAAVRGRKKIHKRPDRRVIYREAKGRLQVKNLKMLCPAQIQHRYEIVRFQGGRHPSVKDIRKHDPRLLPALYAGGGLNKFRAQIGAPVVPRGSKTYQTVEMLAVLRTYHEQRGRNPSRHGWGRLHLSPSADTIRDRFGSWSRALVAAGLM